MFDGRMPAALSVCSTPSAIACTCRGFVPVAMMKKSVNASLLRRSSTTRSWAFFSCAAATAICTAFGKRGRRGRVVVAAARGRRGLGSVMQSRLQVVVVVLGAVEAMGGDVARHGIGYQPVERAAVGGARADLRGGHVRRVRVHEVNRGILKRSGNGRRRDANHARRQVRQP